MSNTLVVIKAADTPSQTSFDMAGELVAGQTISSVSLVSIAPITSPALTATVGVIGSEITLLCSGGAADVTYSVRLNLVCTTPSATKAYTAAVFVQDSSYVSFRTKSSFAFKRILDQIDVGEAAVGSGVFTLPAGTDFTNAIVNWSLLDNEGVTYSRGNAYDYTVTHSSLQARLSGTVGVARHIDATHLLAGRYSRTQSDDYSAEHQRSP